MIPEKYPENKQKVKKSALLVDGNALLKFGYHGAKDEYNHHGEHIGGLYQFLIILRKLMDMKSYDHVFTFWDGPLSGKLRYEMYHEYKGDRDKNYQTGTVSQDKDLQLQKKLVWNYLEQLYVRQMEDYVVESDDLIAYFCKTLSSEYDITICTLDRDMAQLISKSVSIYFCDLKTVVTIDNYNQFFNHHQSNALLIKIIAGDGSDCIKGVRGVKEKTLLNLFPAIAERDVTLGEVLTEAKRLSQVRVENKKKPLIVLENIINGKTNGSQGDKLYELNNKLMNLKCPLLTNKAIEQFECLTQYPIDPAGRDIGNVYTKIRQNGLDRMLTEHQFVNFMVPFKRLMNKERELYNEWLKENGSEG